MQAVDQKFHASDKVSSFRKQHLESEESPNKDQYNMQEGDIEQGRSEMTNEPLGDYGEEELRISVYTGVHRKLRPLPMNIGHHMEGEL